MWTLRWNATFGDINAAGSFYVMALLAAAGLALAAAGRTRALHAAAALCLAAALWLTGSRGALLACLVVVCGGIVIRRARTSLAVWAVGDGRRDPGGRPRASCCCSRSAATRSRG